MTLLWMLVASLVGGGAALAAVALEHGSRALGRPTRWPWVAALLFSTVWPVWLVIRSAVLIGAGSAVAPTATLPAVVISVGRGALTMVAQHRVVFDPRVTTVLVGAWLLATTGLLLRLGIGMWSVHRARRTWIPREVDGVSVLIAPETGPAVVGLRRPAIVLPQWVLMLDPALRELVLRHEQQHVRARDALLRLLGALLPALIPWNVALWLQADRLALAVETDCDARVLSHNARRERYGLLLLAIAQRQSSPMLAPALSEGGSHLERRIVTMQRALPRRPVLVAGGCATAAAIAFVLACSAPTPSAPAQATAGQHAPAAASSSPAAVSTRASTIADAARFGAYADFKVDKQASPYATNLGPRYPDVLEAAHIRGEVITEFVIDTSGRAEMSTFKAIKSDNDLFTDAVKAVLPKDRFYPAEIGGRRVKELVRTPWIFNFRD